MAHFIVMYVKVKNEKKKKKITTSIMFVTQELQNVKFAGDQMEHSSVLETVLNL